MATTLTQSFVRGFTRGLDIIGAKKEWPDIDDAARRDYEALRGDWVNIGEDIKEAIAAYRVGASDA